MAWFLKSSKKNKSKGKAKSSRGSANAGMGRRLIWQLLVVVVVIAAAAAGWYYAEDALRHYVRDTRTTQLSPDDIVLDEQPGWMTPAVAEELKQRVSLQLVSDPLDGTSLQQAAAVLAEAPWVRQVHQVRRLSDGTVLVQADYRQPVAVVEARDGYHLVDDQAVKLPGLYAREQLEHLPLPRIVGVASAPPADAGRQWAGRDVLAGLELMSWLESQPFADQIEAYDVSGRDPQGRVRLSLVTDGGEVIWGYPPGEERMVEVDAKTKLQRLHWIASQPMSQGRIDLNGRRLEIYGADIQELNE